MDALRIGCEPDVTKVAAMDDLRIGCLEEPDITKVAAMDVLRLGCEPDVTEGSSDGCSSNRMLLGTGRY